MSDFESQSQKMDMKEESMEESLDGILDNGQDNEDDTDEIVNQVLDEIGIKLQTHMVHPPHDSSGHLYDNLEERFKNLLK